MSKTKKVEPTIEQQASEQKIFISLKKYEELQIRSLELERYKTGEKITLPMLPNISVWNDLVKYVQTHKNVMLTQLNNKEIPE